jgi:hypothetical protein
MRNIIVIIDERMMSDDDDWRSKLISEQKCVSFAHTMCTMYVTYIPFSRDKTVTFVKTKRLSICYFCRAVVLSMKCMTERTMA